VPRIYHRDGEIMANAACRPAGEPYRSAAAVEW
jgi:hypothetical protein